MHLRPGEDLGNGLSVRESGVSVLSTHALYEMRAGADGVLTYFAREAAELLARR